MPNTLIKTRWVDGNLEFLDSSNQRIAYFDSANRSFVVDASAAIMHGSTSISGTEIALLDTVTAGAIVASKVVARDAGKRIPFETDVPAAAGSTTGDATVLTDDVNLVTAADGTKGVRLPVGVAGMRIEIVNTVTTAVLKVYPDTGGAINGGSADAAFSLASGRHATFVCTAALTWYVEKGAVAMSGDATIDGAGALTIAASAIDNAKVSASAAIARSKLATDTVFLDLEERLRGLDGAVLALSETADDFFRNIGTNQWNINGEAAINETETSSGWFTFVLPENYVAGGTIALLASALVTLAGDAVNDATSTIDMEARLVTKTTGAVGADLVTTAAITLATAGADYSFTVTPTSLVAGDKLVCKLITNMVETAGGTGAANSVITRLGANIQVKG